jgi:aconitate hydratase
VIAFALAGRIDIDLEVEPLGMSPDGTPVYLRDIWPDAAEISTLIHESQRPEQFRQSYATLFDGGALWHSLRAPSGARFAWDAASTYVCPPPFFAAGNTPLPDAITGARVLVKVGDSLTTDHITPSGAIDPASEAGQYLIASGVAPNDFNAVTQRRGNHEFMARITFANQRMKNLLVPGIEGGFTRLSPGAVTTTIYGAAMALRAQDMPAVVLAGRDYGMGSSRDWAAKGPQLLGVRVVLAEGFERIHRSNLIGMGILPLIFAPDSNADTLGLTGFETYLFENLHGAVTAGAPAQVTATSQQGKALHFTAKVDIADDTERDLLMRGGMFAALLDRLENST